MRNGINIHDLNGVEASTSQFPLVGYTVFWRLAGIRVSHSDLEQALLVTGFDKYLPDPPTPRVALRRALAEWIKSKQRIARNLQLQQDDEDQDENGGGRRRTMIRVIDRAGIALLECRDRNTGEPAYAICAINLIRQSGREPEIEMVPFGLMFSCDPYEMLIPASDPEFDDLTKKKKMKAAGRGRRRRRESRPQD